MVHRWANWATPVIEITIPCLTTSWNDHWKCVLIKSYTFLDINLCRLSTKCFSSNIWLLPISEQWSLRFSSTTDFQRRSKPFKRIRCAGLFQGLVEFTFCKVWQHLEITKFWTFFWSRQGIKIQPFSASCNYWRWGPGGMQENINAICVLALNMINDKVTLIDNSIHYW